MRGHLRAGEVQLDHIRTGFRDQTRQLFPRLLVVAHDGGNQDLVRELGLQAAQHPARILRQRVGQRLVVEALPCPWRPLLGRIGPGVAIVEVEQETQARLLDALGQGHDIVQVLAHALPLVLCRGMGGLDEEAKAHGVHALAGEEGQGAVDGRTRLVVVFCPLGLVGGKQGNIAPDIALGHGGDRSTQQEGQKKDPFRHKNHFFYIIIPHRTD